MGILQFGRKTVAVFLAAAVMSVMTLGLAAADDGLLPVADNPARLIVIDPGHGGYDSGAVGPGGTAEKEVTLSLARLIAARMDSRYRVMLTRTDDYQVAVEDRVALANHNQANLLISLHAGGGFSTQQGAITVYFLNSVTGRDKGADPLADTGAAVDRPYIIWEAAHYAHHHLGKAFAEVLKQACDEVPGNYCREKSDRLTVLQGAEMPAVMVEVGCLANPSWEKDLANPDRLVVLADMVCRAIDRFFQSGLPVGGDDDGGGAYSY